MTETDSAPGKRQRSAARAGYAKGDETRQRILDAALTAFGEAPFKAITTRRIAAAAAVSLPTLQYYFGDKEGLYRACAEAIVERYRGHTGGAAREAREALDENCVAETARAHLKAVVGALARFLIGSTEAAHWAPFVAREMRDPGPAFDLLYDRLWRPGVELTARLIARIEDASESNPGVRIEALLLIAGLLAFQSGRGIALRAMHWRTIGPDELALVRARLDERIDAIGRPSSFGGF